MNIIVIIGKRHKHELISMKIFTLFVFVVSECGLTSREEGGESDMRRFYLSPVNRYQLCSQGTVNDTCDGAKMYICCSSPWLRSILALCPLQNGRQSCLDVDRGHSAVPAPQH